MGVKLACSFLCATLLTSRAAMGQAPPVPSPAPAPPPAAPSAAPFPGQQPPASGAPAVAPPPPPSAGGLVAPPPLQGATSSQPSASQQLKAAEEEDSGRGLSWLYLDVEGGYQFVGLETFDVDTSNLTAGFVKDEASGAFVGVGLGARLVFLTIGPRARVGFFDDWQLYSIGGELGFRFPLGRVEPYFTVGAGYSALGELSGALQGADNSVEISGFDVRALGGLDFFPTTWLSLGGGASWEFLGLTRPGVSFDSLNAPASANLDDAQKTALAAEGSGYGTSITVSGRLGLHF